MKLKAIHRKRLEKLIAFLRQLPRKRFDLSIIRNEPPKCGAVGCAIGYTPNVFPSVFKSRRSYFTRYGTHDIVFRRGSADEDRSYFNEVASWLTGIEDRFISGKLFVPEKQHLVHPELQNLPESATPKQVARVLEKFIKLHSK